MISFLMYPATPVMSLTSMVTALLSAGTAYASPPLSVPLVLILADRTCSPASICAFVMVPSILFISERR